MNCEFNKVGFTEDSGEPIYNIVLGGSSVGVVFDRLDGTIYLESISIASYGDISRIFDCIYEKWEVNRYVLTDLDSLNDLLKGLNKESSRFAIVRKEDKFLEGVWKVD